MSGLFFVSVDDGVEDDMVHEYFTRTVLRWVSTALGGCKLTGNNAEGLLEPGLLH